MVLCGLLVPFTLPDIYNTLRRHFQALRVESYCSKRSIAQSVKGDCKKTAQLYSKGTICFGSYKFLKNLEKRKKIRKKLIRNVVVILKPDNVI
jgi:hypothetical protein